MKKIIITIAIALLSSLTAMAEIRRVAVFDPAGNAPSHVNEIVREIASSVIVNTPGFTVLERSLIDQVLRENRFQAEGLVDDAQISEMGRMMGANLTFVINLTRMGDGNFFISARLIDVQTARIEKQQTARTSRTGETELINTSERLAQEMFAQVTQAVVVPPPIAIAPVNRADMLTADRRNVFQGGRQLNQMEVRQLMAGTEALRFYQRGLQRIRTGNIFMYCGFGVIASGGLWVLIGPLGNRYDYPTGTIIAITGVATAVTGLIIRNAGRGDLSRSIDMFNRQGRMADNIELNLGVTNNGFGLTLNF